MKSDTKYVSGDRIFFVLTLSCALLVLFIFTGILLSLIKESQLSLQVFGLFWFPFQAVWDPVQGLFGAAVPLVGTFQVTLIALVLAIPFSLGIVVFITEVCPVALRGIFSTAIELLAAIPSIIYGMWGLFTFAPLMGEYVEPFLQKVFGWIPFFGLLFQGTPLGIDVLTAAIVLSIMIIPFIASIGRDSVLLTPTILKESAYAVGSTKWEVVKNVIFPYSRYGIYGGIVIALGRALGETMAVAFVLGNRHDFSRSLLDATTTITVTLANEFTEADSDLYFSSLFSLALVLFISSFIILALAKYLVYRGTKLQR